MPQTTFDYQYVTPSLGSIVAVMHLGSQAVKASDGSLVTYNSTNIASTAIAGSDANGMANYVFTVPSGTAAGDYHVTIHQRAGGSLALSDTYDTLGEGTISWDGTGIVGASSSAGSIDPAAIVNGVLAGLVGQNLGPIYGVAGASSLDLFGADSYQTAEGRGIAVTKQSNETQWPTTLSTVHFYAHPTKSTLVSNPAAAKLDDVACTVNTATGSSQAFTLQLSAVQLLTLQAAEKSGGYKFWFVANKSTNPATLRAGAMTVRPGPASVV